MCRYRSRSELIHNTDPVKQLNKLSQAKEDLYPFLPSTPREYTESKPEQHPWRPEWYKPMKGEIPENILEDLLSGAFSSDTYQRIGLEPNRTVYGPGSDFPNTPAEEEENAAGVYIIFVKVNGKKGPKPTTTDWFPIYVGETGVAFLDRLREHRSYAENPHADRTPCIGQYLYDAGYCDHTFIMKLIPSKLVGLKDKDDRLYLESQLQKYLETPANNYDWRRTRSKRGDGDFRWIKSCLR